MTASWSGGWRIIAPGGGTTHADIRQGSMTRLTHNQLAGAVPAERRLPDTDLLRELWADRDLTVPDIAARLGTTKVTILKRAARMGLPPRRSYSRNARRSAAETLAARLADQARLRELWADPGLPLADIAEQLGVSRATVRMWAAQMGLPPTPRPPRPTTRRTAEQDRAREQLPELWADTTLTTTQIADMLRVARGTVSVWAAQLGLPERPRGRKRAPRPGQSATGPRYRQMSGSPPRSGS